MSGFRVITLQYLPFLVRAMTQKIISLNLGYLCHKYVELQRCLKDLKVW